MSLDRVIPSLGYVRGNVVLCTFWMNTMKGNRTKAEFLDACKTVVRRLSCEDHPVSGFANEPDAGRSVRTLVEQVAQEKDPVRP